MQVLKWKNTDFTKGLFIKPMQENLHSKEISITLPKDAVLDDHKAPSKICVQVLSGKIEFEVEQEVYILEALDSITLDKGIVHALRGLEDSIVRLSLYGQ